MYDCETYPRLELSIANLKYNINHFRAQLKPETKLLVLLKADAYGHGATIIAREVQDIGVDYIAVAFTSEGVELRKAGVAIPILVLTGGIESFKDIIDYHLEPGLPDIKAVRLFDEYVASRHMKNYPCHIKIDSGMHRVGFSEDDLHHLTAFLKEGTMLKIKSVYSHLAGSDDPMLDDFTMEQKKVFDSISSRIEDVLGYSPLRHLLNTAGIERFAKLYPDMQYDMVRLGVGLYGIKIIPGQDIRPVGSLHTKICQIKHLSEGTVGYSRRGVIDKPSVIATIPLGYADGIDRRLGNGRARFLLNGKLAPTIGSICMDACMLDITGIEANEGDVVTIYGENPTVADIAEILGTIPYEVATSVSRRVNRVLVDTV